MIWSSKEELVRIIIMVWFSTRFLCRLTAFCSTCWSRGAPERSPQGKHRICCSNTGSAYFHVSWLSDFIFYPKPQALDVQWMKWEGQYGNNSVTVMWGKMVSLLYNKEKASNAFFSTNVNKSVYFFVYGFRLTFAVLMGGDLPNSFSAA